MESQKTDITQLLFRSGSQENVALKLLYRDVFKGQMALERLAAEVQTARQIRHPGIVAVHDIGVDDGQAYMSMEYVAGSSLRAWLAAALQAGKDVPVPVAIGIVLSVLDGLGEAHRMGVVHRDLKPENLLLLGDPFAQDFRLKILDFGIARASAPADNSRVTTAGRALGTPLYMAPEQHTAAETVKPSADLYSVSAILYELLMGLPPQGNFKMPGALRQDVPKVLDEALARGLNHWPRDRFQSAEDYAAALTKVTAALRTAQENGSQVTKAKPLEVETVVLIKKDNIVIPKSALWRNLGWGLFFAFSIALAIYNMPVKKDPFPHFPKLETPTFQTGPQTPVKRPLWLPPGFAMPRLGG